MVSLGSCGTTVNMGKALHYNVTVAINRLIQLYSSVMDYCHMVHHWYTYYAEHDYNIST